MYCKSCGKELNVEDRFCSLCGAPVEKKETSQPTREDFQMRKETEFAYKQVNSMQNDRFEEEWEREERKETLTFMLFGVLIVVLIVAITCGVLFLMKTGGTQSLDDNVQVSDNPIGNAGVGNMFSPDVSGNQEAVVTPQLIKPNENVSQKPEQNTSQETTGNPNHGDSNEREDRTEFIIYDSDVRYLVSADLNGLSAWEIRVARNEIYARHGRMFDSLELKEYFESKSWYVPEIPAVEFNISCLNEVELENLNFIIHYEKAHNLN